MPHIRSFPYITTPTATATATATTHREPHNCKAKAKKKKKKKKKAMACSRRKPTQNPRPLYPEVVQSNPDANSPFLSSSSSTTPLYPCLHDPPPAATTTTTSSMYPTIDMRDLVENLFPDGAEEAGAVAEKGKDRGVAPDYPNLFRPPVEETLIRVPGAILHLIDRQRSVDLGSGEFSVVCLRQGDSVVAVLARVGDDVQWPLAKDEAAVRVDESHYFFSLHVPEGPSDAGDEEWGAGGGGDGSADLLNYGLTFASKGQEELLRELDGILDHYSSFSVQKVAAKAEVLDDAVAKETAPAEVTARGLKREMMEERSAAYWTTLAPNVEDYSGCVARVIAVGSGQLIKGILWCGDVTVDRMKWGNDLLKNRMEPNAQPTEISKQALRRMKRVKRVTKMSEKVVGGILSGVVKVSGFFTSSVVNSKAGKKFFSLLPGEIVLASLDGFGKICDAVEVVGKNVLSTSSTVTTEVVSHRYGEQAAELTNEGLDATGHAIGTAWAVFKIRKALNPKNSIKPSTIVKSAAKAKAAELKAKQAK